MFEETQREKRAKNTSDPFAPEAGTGLNDTNDPGHLRRWAQFLRAHAKSWGGGRGVPGVDPTLFEAYRVE